jgi:hypothetical protein
MELSGLNSDYASLAVEIQQKMSEESTILGASFPAQTITLLANTLAGGLAMLNYSQLTHNLNNFTPFAFLKSAGYAIAATLGVAPRRKSAAQTKATFIPQNGQATFINQIPEATTIPAYTRFISRGLVWHSRESYTIKPTDTQLNMILFEGDIVYEEFNSLGEKYHRWFIGNPYEVDNNSIRVLIDNVFWTEAIEGSFVYYSQSQPVFIQQTSPDGKVLVFFGNGRYGRIPPRDSVVRIYYTVTLGAAGNDSGIGGDVSLIDRVLVGPNQGLVLSGFTTTPSIGGEDEHSLDDIKYVIPRLYAAANRAVRRNDYVGHLLGARCPIALADATTWGEYEQAQLEGLNKLTMMNRAYWTGVLSSSSEVDQESIVIVASPAVSFSFQIPEDTLIPGSVLVTNDYNSLQYTDTDGNGVLVCQDVSLNQLTGGVVSSNGTAAGSSASYVTDNNFATSWQSDFAPGVGVNAKRIMFDWGVGVTQVPKSYRIRSSGYVSRNERAFPKAVSFWATNILNPRIDRDDDWTPLRGRTYLNDPGPITFTPWITLKCTTAYRYVMIKIEDRYGNQSFARIGEWEVQTGLNSSSINYQSMDVAITYPTPIPAGQDINISYFTPDLDVDQQKEIFTFLKNLNHYTTDINYVSPVMIRDNIDVEVYYQQGYDQNNLYSQIQTNLSEMFRVKKGFINRKITHSDLTEAVVSITGVDYCIFLSPVLGGDLYCDFGQYHHLSSLKISMYVTDRATS